MVLHEGQKLDFSYSNRKNVCSIGRKLKMLLTNSNQGYNINLIFALKQKQYWLFNSFKTI